MYSNSNTTNTSHKVRAFTCPHCTQWCDMLSVRAYCSHSPAGLTHPNDESELVFMEAALTLSSSSAYYTQLRSVYHCMKHAYSKHMYWCIHDVVCNNPCSPRYRHIHERIVHFLETRVVSQLMRIGYRKRSSRSSADSFVLVLHLCDVTHNSRLALIKNVRGDPFLKNSTVTTFVLLSMHRGAEANQCRQ